MKIINYECKAKANNINLLEDKLQQLHPRFVGEDKQIDTYFNVATGRLKLREGNIENSLIYYQRPDTADAKQSDVLLYEHSNSTVLKDILMQLHGIKVVVDKVRKIYFIDNVKFHFDTVKNLGTFVEIEAQASAENADIDELQSRCNFYINFFQIQPDHFIHCSYSDLILQNSVK